MQQRTRFLFMEADEAVLFGNIYPAFSILPEVSNSAMLLSSIETGKVRYWYSENELTSTELIMLGILQDNEQIQRDFHLEGRAPSF